MLRHMVAAICWIITNFTAKGMNNMFLDRHAWHCLAVLICCCGGHGGHGGGSGGCGGGQWWPWWCFHSGMDHKRHVLFCTNSGLNFILI